MDNIRVLLVEDSAYDAELIGRALEEGGYTLHSLRVDTRNAMKEALLRERWDMIISDYRLPQFSGLDALHLLKELELDIPLILVSGTIGEETAVAAMKAGAHDYLMKDNLKRLGPVVKRELEESAIRRMRHVAQEALRASEERFRLIAENVADLIAVLDLEGKRVYNSPSYAKLLGDPASLIGTDSFAEIHPDDRERVRKVFQETVATGKGQRLEYRLVATDGRERDIESLGSVILDKEGKPWRVVVVSRDVTDTKMLEEQFQQAQKMESVGTLAGGIAHDFNNILGIILGHVTFLKRRSSDPNVLAKSIEAIEQAVQRGAGMVRQILTLARKSPVTLGPLSVNTEIESLTKLLHQTFPKTIQVLLDLDKTLPVIQMDQAQFHQALLNLCVNARDAMMEGGGDAAAQALTIRTSLVTADAMRVRFVDVADVDYVRIAVIDNGAGMSEATRKKIFEPFFTTKEKGKGTGLGLAVVYGVVKAHRGFIGVESEPGRGTTFELFFPVSGQIAPHAVRDIQKEAEAPRGNETVLLVEDEEGLRTLLKESLEEKGYSILTAADGIEAINTYTAEMKRIAVVLSDMGMPRLNGSAMYAALKAINPKVKVVFITGYVEMEVREELMEAGVRGFIDKPFLLDTVIRRIREIIDAR